ncbi:unnamed protein product, partial [Laminaria digitata]
MICPTCARLVETTYHSVPKYMHRLCTNFHIKRCLYFRTEWYTLVWAGRCFCASCSVATLILYYISFQELFRALRSCPVATSKAGTKERTHACCVLPFQLATPPRFQVSHIPEGEPCIFN